MNRGLAVPRGWVFVLRTGEYVIDWGDGRVQDLLSGEFQKFTESQYGRAISDSDLASLKNNGRVESYDSTTVYLRPLPEPPLRTIE
ncbi:MAG: hypothetical protein A2Z37_17420 [Chloroflexi bacterium RBG_19FT_COMBO_62_14]|nr:MAG: hypothetical protein A2Z37_17420 [Chloroflexi bacterium RBG_19FT_COMBO_62_14]